MVKKKIKCIGFSVTSYGSPPYPVLLNQQLNDAGFDSEVSYHATGGLSIDSLPYLMNGFVKDGEADLIIFEITTSWFSLIHSNVNAAIKFVRALVAYCENMGVRIIFLNLYRKNIDDRDIVVQAIEELCLHKYPILNYKQMFREDLHQRGDDGTIDGVHPNQIAIQKIVDTLCAYIIENYSTLKTYHLDEMQLDSLELILPYQLKQYGLLRFENRHGINLDAYKIPPNTTIQIEFETAISITGIFFLYGPDTNQINLICSDNKINIPMQDELSFYRRLGYKHIGTVNTKALTLEHPIERVNAKLMRQTDLGANDCNNYIVGLTKLLG